MPDHRVPLANGLLIVLLTTWGIVCPAHAAPQENSADVQAQTNDAAGVEWFEKRVRPIFVEKCYECHGPELQENGLRLDRFAELARGGASGPVIVPGRPDSSLLITAIRYGNPDLQMPPDGKLSNEQIEAIRQWITMGAPHPDSTGSLPRVEPQSNTHAQIAEHWAWQPPTRPTLPTVRDTTWPTNPVDLFVLAKLEDAGLRPASAADRRTLIRRATFDLTGLPPTEEEIERFLSDTEPGAFDRLVDRLLASPRYGQRWGRHWLDVARYADTNGLDENLAYGNAWRYRDYVIEAFNADMPFDQFIHEQLAGDLLPWNDPAERNRLLIATGFLSLGPKVLAEVDEQKMEMDIVDEQIDTVGKAFLAVTLGCARCHDHKFDPVAIEDYYALAGIFKSTHTMDSFTKIARWYEHTLDDPNFEARQAAHQAAIEAKQAALDAAVQAATRQVLASRHATVSRSNNISEENPDATTNFNSGADAGSNAGSPSVQTAANVSENQDVPENIEEQFPAQVREEIERLRTEITRLKDNPPRPPTAMGVRDGEPTDARIHVRGSHLTLGDTVKRRMPAALSANSASQPIGSGTSGRLELAHWITDDPNRLAARVLVNRVWHWHFGRGIVETTDNFGQLGEAPTHPELLDWLAVEFIRGGWSIKRLHRRIMLSATYRMASEHSGEGAERDPQNRLLWRAPVRRLEAEPLRDALLAVSGELDERHGGPTLNAENRSHVFDHTSRDQTQYHDRRRSVYLPVVRNHLHDSFTLFDYTDASTPNGHRASSTVPTQALYLMNSDFVVDASRRLAERALAQPLESDAQRINWLYRTALGRPASPAEQERMCRYLERLAAAASGRGGDDLVGKASGAQPAEASGDVVANAFAEAPGEPGSLKGHDVSSAKREGELDSSSDVDEAGRSTDARRTAWQMVCHAILMSNEFLYVR